MASESALKGKVSHSMVTICPIAHDSGFNWEMWDFLVSTGFTVKHIERGLHLKGFFFLI